MNTPASKTRERKRAPNNRTTTGFRISDELWEVLYPLLPVHVNTHRFGGIERPEPTETQPQGMCLDNGYDYEEVRDILRE